MAGLNLTAWTSWFIGTAVGCLAGSIPPARLESAMGVAIYALFASLLAPIARSSGPPIFCL